MNVIPHFSFPPHCQASLYCRLSDEGIKCPEKQNHNNHQVNYWHLVDISSPRIRQTGNKSTLYPDIKHFIWRSNLKVVCSQQSSQFIDCLGNSFTILLHVLFQIGWTNLEVCLQPVWLVWLLIVFLIPSDFFKQCHSTLRSLTLIRWVQCYTWQIWLTSLRKLDPI